MPLDFNLVGQAPRINTPFENLATVLQVRNQQEAALGLREQRQGLAEQRRVEAEQKRQEAAAAAQVRTLFGRPNQPPTPDELASVIGPEAATKIFQGFADLQKATGANQDASRARVASVLGAIKAFPEPLRAGAYDGARAHLIADGTLKPEDAPEKYEPTFIDNALRAAMAPKDQLALDTPKAPIHVGDSLVQPNAQGQYEPVYTAPVKPEKVTYGAPQTQMVNGRRSLVRAGSDGRMYNMNLKPIEGDAIAPEPVAGPGPDNSPLETIIGPNGTPIRVRRQDAIGKAPATGTMKPASGVEKRALNFFNRAQQADGELEQLEGEIQKMGLAQQGRLALAPNFMQSQTGQSYDAAQRAFTEARLRKDSGAAIPDGEFANDRKTYFAQPGDSQQTLEQKRRARGALLASLAFESGQALGEFVGDADEAKAIVQKYKDRSSGTTAKPKADPLGIR